MLPLEMKTNPFLNKIHYLFWLVSALMLLLAYQYGTAPAADNIMIIDVYDFYFVIEILHFALFLALFYFLLGFGYWLVKRVKGRLNSVLTYVHVSIMFGSLLAYGIALVTQSSATNSILVICISVIVFIAQPMYVINLMVGIFNWRKDRKIRL